MSVAAFQLECLELGSVFSTGGAVQGTVLGSIPPSHLETASVAGATAWQKLRDIILPLIKTHIVTDLILITLWSFNTFTPFLLTGGGPAFKTDLVAIFTYREAFKFFRFGEGSASAW